MTGSATQNPLLNEVVTFIQNDIPGFGAGMYRLTVTQSLTDATGAAINDAPISLTYDFGVSGDRFAFAKPDQSVLAVFPPDNASGGYDAVFPHVVLPQSNLPWLRSPTIDHPEPDAENDLPSWLWVMLLDEADQAAHTGLSLTPTIGVVGDLFPTAVYGPSTLGTAVSTFSQAKDASALEPGQALDSPIQYVDLPLALFWQIAPTLADLRLMAHVREVGFTQKPTLPGITDQGVPTGKFAITFGNRLPLDGVNSACFLVSLEALEDVLPTEQGLPPQPGMDSGKSIRLAMLRTWRFRSTGQPATFVNALLALNDGTSDGLGHRQTALRLDYAGTDPLVAGALEMGYAPLNTVLRTGENTVSWYRGPLAPYAVTTSAPPIPLSSADAALSFDPTSGMLDMSYSAAWTIGRLIALQDQSFSVPLYVWKRDLHHVLMASVSGAMLSDRLAALGDVVLPQRLQSRLEAAANPGALGSFKAAHHLVLNALKKGI